MPCSYYLKTFPFPDKPGFQLLFSTRRCALILAPEALASLIQQGEAPAEHVEALTKLGFLVPDQEAEKNAVLHFHDELNRLNSGLSLAMVLGLGCNFACCYCFEGTQKGRQVMDQQTANQLIAFIKERLPPGKDKLRLAFYGGETLLYLDLISHICSELQPFLTERGVALDGTVVTNGSLLTPKNIRTLVRHGVTYAKVTIDGPAENHDRFRPFKNGRGSFAAIMKNLKACRGMIDLSIAGNYTAESFHTFPLLLDELLKNGLTPDTLARVKFNAVMQTTDRFSLPDFHDGCRSANEPWAIEAALFVREEILRRGFKTPTIEPEICALEIKDDLCVHYDGSLYKCMPLVGHREFAVGDIWSGVKDFRASHHLDSWRNQRQCLECTYLPLCFGGCRYATFQRDGSMAGLDCRKPYFDAALGPLLAQDVGGGRPHPPRD